MRKHILGIVAALALFASPAAADWTGKNAAGTTITFSNSVDCTSGTCIPIAALVNAAGATLYGTAGTANAGVLSVQGIASMTPLLVTPSSVALPANQSVNVSQINAVTPLMGNGATGTGSPRVTLSNDNTIPTGWPTSAKQDTGNTSAAAIAVSVASIDTKASLALPAQTGIGNVNIGAVQSAGSAYETVAASQTGQALGATGAIGDYLSHCVIYPVTTGAGLVTVFDSTSSATNNVITFTSGTLSNLAPIALPVGALSLNGAWKVTTGTNVTVTCYGKFT